MKARNHLPETSNMPFSDLSLTGFQSDIVGEKDFYYTACGRTIGILCIFFCISFPIQCEIVYIYMIIAITIYKFQNGLNNSSKSIKAKGKGKQTQEQKPTKGHKPHQKNKKSEKPRTLKCRKKWGRDRELAHRPQGTEATYQSSQALQTDENSAQS